MIKSFRGYPEFTAHDGGKPTVIEWMGRTTIDMAAIMQVVPYYESDELGHSCVVILYGSGRETIIDASYDQVVDWWREAKGE